jgi:histidine triad (HIT) family protein
MSGTIFSKIINREIPATIVYENEHTLAFLDAHPVNPGHTLVVPKKYFKDLYDIDDETLCHITRTVQKVARAVKHAVNADGINIHQNNEPAAGQVVFHTHTHIIPRFNNDGLPHWHGSREYYDGEEKELAEKIKNALLD